MIKSSLNASCNDIFLDFWWSVFFLLVTLRDVFTPLKYCLCWICTSNKNKALKTINFNFSVILWNLLRSEFWNHLLAEKIAWSSIFLDFSTVFHFVWKNQESCESWLVGFLVSRCSKRRKIWVNKLFFAFLSRHYGITNYCEILNFLILNLKL